MTNYYLERMQRAAESYFKNARPPVVQDELDEEWARRLRMIEAAPEMYRLLKEIELQQFDAYGEGDYCSFCRGWSEHKPDCRLAAVLKSVEEP